MKDVDSETLQHLMKIAQKMNAALRKSKYPCDGVNLFLADGEAAHQEIFHFHLHVYPRYFGDGFGFKYEKGKHFQTLERAKMEEIAAEVKRHLEMPI